MLEIRLPPEWDAVKSAWDPCRTLLHGCGLGDDETYSLCMVAQELLENAVKYGSFEPGGEVELRLDVGSREIVVEARNPVGPDPGCLREFDQTIQWIRGFQDPFEAYVERMKIVSSQPYGDARSGLGLTRIAYEGRCVLDFYVDATNTLAVSAVYRR